MNAKRVMGMGCMLLMTRLGMADASYQETTQITGGQLVDTLKSVPFAQKRIQKIFDPIVSSKMLHGNQLVSVSKSSAEIIDLDKETITHIDVEKKTFTVMTFAQMRQAIQDAPKKLAQAQAKAKQAPASKTAPEEDTPASQLQVTYEVSVLDTGVSKVVNGLPAKEQLLTLKAHVTDPTAPPSNGPNTVTYSYIADIWSAPEPPEVKEINDFFVRYAKKMMQGVDTAALVKSMKPALGGGAIAPLFAANPGMGPALQEMMKKMAVEMQKIKGIPVLEVTRLGGEGLTASPGTVPASPPPPPVAPGSAIAGQVATDTATGAVASQAGKLGALGSAFGHSMLSALHHNSDPATPPSGAAAGAPAASSAVLYETTTQKSSFSQEPVPATAFLVPAGYTQVVNPAVNGTSQ